MLQKLIAKLGVGAANVLLTALFNWVKDLIDENITAIKYKKEVHEAVKRLRASKTPEEIKAALRSLNL